MAEEEKVKEKIVYVERKRRGCLMPLLAIIVIAAIAGGIYTATNPAKTATNNGTSVPLAKAAPAPPLSEMAANKKSMTDAQWDAYADTLKGKGISGWTGTVQSVDQKPLSDDYRMIVDTADPVPGYAFDVYVDVAKADALKISKNAAVSVSGTIKKVDCIITNCPIELDNAVYTLK